MEDKYNSERMILMKLRKTLSLLIAVLMLSTLLAATASADFNIAGFKSNRQFTVTPVDASTDCISINKASYPYFQENRVVFDAGTTGQMSMSVQIENGAQSPYVFQMVLKYYDAVLPTARSVTFLTASHRYAFTPIVKQGVENGQNVETIILNLADEASLNLAYELTYQNSAAMFAVQGVNKNLSGNIFVGQQDALSSFCAAYVAAGGLQQELTAARAATPCEIIQIVQIYDNTPVTTPAPAPATATNPQTVYYIDGIPWWAYYDESYLTQYVYDYSYFPGSVTSGYTGSDEYIFYDYDFQGNPYWWTENYYGDATYGYESNGNTYWYDNDSTWLYNAEDNAVYYDDFQQRRQTKYDMSTNSYETYDYNGNLVEWGGYEW